MGFLRKQETSQPRTWGVGDLTAYIRELIELDFRLQNIDVEGEVSNLTLARSGHLYFTLKDDKAQVKCVMWRNAVEMNGYVPESGDAVVVSGRLGVYDASGVYQIYAERIDPAGRGELAIAFEKLKLMLAEEGLFDAERKRPIPTAPKKIGIVTSADAAALRDMLNVLQRRYPIADVLIAPTLVQGKTAPAQIVRALQWLDGRDDIDVIIIGRGGGSIEDLWAFNDEQVARAVANTFHPIVSGVGHETDFTICDFVADLRAPTPSAAAELVVPDQTEIWERLAGLDQALTYLVYGKLQTHEAELNALNRTLRQLTPRAKLDNGLQRLDSLTDRLRWSMQRQLRGLQSDISLLGAQLSAVNPTATLARGYAIVRTASGEIVRSVNETAVNEPLTIQVTDGTIDTTVTKITPSKQD